MINAKFPNISEKCETYTLLQKAKKWLKNS